ARRGVVPRRRTDHGVEPLEDRDERSGIEGSRAAPRPRARRITEDGTMSLWAKHRILEKNSILLVIGILIVVSIGGLVEIVPLFYLRSTIEAVEGVRPYTPLELVGR